MSPVASAITNKTIDNIDGAEWPDEPVTWPYRLAFSTKEREAVETDRETWRDVCSEYQISYAVPRLAAASHRRFAGRSG